MRLTALLLTIAFVHAYASSSGQITLSGKNLTLDQVFSAVEKQTGYVVLSNEELLASGKTISLEVRDLSLHDLLDMILKGLPYEYTVADKTIFISHKSPASLDKQRIRTVTELLTALPVSGQVIDAEGRPVPGATIRIVKSKRGTATDINGRFTLSNIEDGAVLEVSAIGFAPISLRLSGDAFVDMSPSRSEPATADAKPSASTLVNGASGSLLIKLIMDVSKLNELQVIAYGTTTQRLSTGNISTVTAKDIEKSPTTNVLLAIQGRVPGIYIRQNGGLPGSSMEVAIQGKNSISKGNIPFYVVDGVPYTSELFYPLTNILQGASNPLSYINPQDIESITILKDADATSIYGSRAANGAILITTKKGKAGDSRVNLNVQHGIGQVAKKMDLMNTQQYLKTRRQAIANDGINLNEEPWNTPNWFTAFVDLTTWDTTRYTDWQEELIGNNAQYSDANISFTGGNNYVNYAVRGNYHRETTVFPGDFADRRASIHFNINSISRNNRFRMQFSGSYLKDDNRLPDADMTSNAINLPPNAPALYNADGSLNWEYANGVRTFDNPLALKYIHYSGNTANLIGSASLSYQLVKGLEIKSTFGYNGIDVKEIQYNDDEATDPVTLQNPSYSRYASYGNNQSRTWNVEPQINYAAAFGNHHLNILLGSTFQQSTNLLQSYWADGFSSDKVLQNIAAATSITVRSSEASDYKYNAIFGRIGYDYNQKYILNLNVRRDGSSRFGPENSFHNFASLAGAWIFSEEPFIKEGLPFLSFGKIRASYGTSGNDQVGNYAYFSLYNNLTSTIPYQDGAGTGLYPINLPNPYLQWELTRKTQFGLDLGFINDRILLNLNYNLNRSSNQLLYYTLSSVTGFTGISANFPATVQNAGWEISLSTVNIKNRKVQWNTAINLTIPQNKLIAFENLENSSYASSLVIGKSINTDFFYEFAGVNPATGMYQYYNHERQLVSEPNFSYDRTVIKNRDPRYYGGVQNSITYKGITLDFLFNFASQLTRDYTLGFNRPGGRYNNPVSILDNVWQKEGDAATVQQYSNGFSAIPSARAINRAYLGIAGSDAGNKMITYCRLKNISLSWQLPDAWNQRAHFQSSRIFLQGLNLLTFTGYKGLDPEMSGLRMPPLRVITVGLNVSI